MTARFPGFEIKLWLGIVSSQCVSKFSYTWWFPLLALFYLPMFIGLYVHDTMKRVLETISFMLVEIIDPGKKFLWDPFLWQYIANLIVHYNSHFLKSSYLFRTCEIVEKRYLNSVITGRKMGFCFTAQSFYKQSQRKVLGRQLAGTVMPLIAHSPEASYGNCL